MIVNIATQIATEAHLGQIRQKNQESYINHLIRVRDSVEKRFDKVDFYREDINGDIFNEYQLINNLIKNCLYSISPNFDITLNNLNTLKKILLSISVLHDSKEDRPELITNQYLKEKLSAGIDNDISVENINLIIQSVNVLTRIPNDPDYFSYLKTVKQNSITTVVKLFDMEDNLRDLEPCNLRAKYELGKYFLLN